ncbi:MAG: cobalamin B12-binding domain-containing protein [Candidatus Nealsonbacteria bacterium]|nr:cobalamin B12-binding domain-containing protein [Candidatus Nealsonbacteria bacterium]
MGWEDDMVSSILRAEEDNIMAEVRRQIDAGVAASEILANCNRGMVELGERFSEGSCFLPELMFGGMIMKSILAELGPLLEKSGKAAKTGGTIVIGTVEHDVHDIGKDIVVMTLRGVGFEVIDLGVNVPPQGFVDAIRLHRPLVVGLSVLLTTCFKAVEATTEAIRQAGLRDGLSIMVGGAAAGDLLRINAGCDYYGKTAIDGVKYAGSLAAAQ